MSQTDRESNGNDTPTRHMGKGSLFLCGAPELGMFPSRLDRQRALAGVSYEADRVGTGFGIGAIVFYGACAVGGGLLGIIISGLFMQGSGVAAIQNGPGMGFAYGGAIVAILAAMWWQHRRVGRRVLRRHLLRCGVPICLKCGYDLRGLPGATGQCPECGVAMNDCQRELLILDKTTSRGSA